MFPLFICYLDRVPEKKFERDKKGKEKKEKTEKRYNELVLDPLHPVIMVKGISRPE